ADAFVLAGRAYEMEQTLPFAPWVAALRSADVGAHPELLAGLKPQWRAQLARLLPELQGPVPSAPGVQADETQLFESALQLLHRLAAIRPVALVLEDMHWADEMSVRLCFFVARRIETGRILLVLTAREEDMPEALLLGRSLHELERARHLVRLPLRQLSRPDTAALVRAVLPRDTDADVLAGIEERVWQASRGLPFFAIETVRALAETSPAAPLPQRIQDVVSARLARLSEPARRLLELAAVVGGFDAAMLEHSARFADCDPEHVEELVRRRLLSCRGERCNFAHELIRQAVYAQMPSTRRRYLHAKAAAAIEATSTGNVAAVASALGVHYRAAEQWERAAASLHRAGRHAMERAANREAVTCLEQALEVLKRVPETPATLRRAIEIRFDLRSASLLLGDLGGIEQRLEEASALAVRAGTPRLIGRAAAYMSHYFCLSGRHDQAIETGETARIVAETASDLTLIVAARLSLGRARFASGRFADAAADFAAVLKVVAESPGDRMGRVTMPSVESRTWLAWCLAELGQFDEATGHAEDAVRLAEAAPHPRDLIYAYRGLGHLLAMRGRLVEAVDLLDAALRLSRRLDTPLLVHATAPIVGYAYALCGRISEGLELVEDGLAGRGPIRILTTRPAWVSEVNLMAGRHARAHDVAQTALAASRQRGERGDEAYLRRALGQFWLAEKQVAAAEAEFEAARELADGLGLRPLAAHVWLGLARVHGMAGAPIRARKSARTAERLFQEMGMGYWATRAVEAVAG
ncbi:MAG TPA: AAA family ATPase, partial [Methylomirabilota bacterium]|nr:AAA family ATPase [Methylomirabilota bacterium]